MVRDGKIKVKDFVQLEQRRMEAICLFEQGMKQIDIARRVGVTRQAVNTWVKAYKKGGLDALRRKKHLGPKRKLSNEQLAKVPEILLKGTQAYGYATDLWTTERVAEVIKREFRVKYHPDHISNCFIAWVFHGKNQLLKP